MLDFLELGFIIETVIGAMLAATSKGTARWQIQGAGNFALNGLNLFTGAKINLEDCLHQGLGIGMLAAFCNAPMLQPFHHIAQIHDGHLMTH